MATSADDWQDHESIERWMADWRKDAAHQGPSFAGLPDPIDEMRHRIMRSDFIGKDRESVEAFLAASDVKSHRVSELGKADREERAIAAAEQSAKWAERSARWAGWAIAVALAALVVSARPYVKDWRS